MTNTKIEVLVKKVQEDKNSFFEGLYEEVWKKVYYSCYKNLGNEADAYDAMQTIFIKLYNQIDTLKSPEAFNKFLRTILSYTCADFHRAKYRNGTDDLETYEDVIEEEKTEFLPIEAYERQDIREKISEMVGELPAKQREAILLFYYDNLPIKEVAEIMSIEVNAVKNNLFKARKSLRERANVLVEKGALTIPMVIVSVPIITKILTEEANALATTEVGVNAWQAICGILGIAGAAAGVAGSAATTTTTTTVTTTAATSSAVVNLCIGLACAVVLAGTVYLGFYVNDTFINPTPPNAIVAEYEESDDLDIVSLIREIDNQADFLDFVDIFDFAFLSKTESTETGNRMLFYTEDVDRFIYLGYIENLQGEFRVLYEITPERLPTTDEDIAEWFARV